MRLSRTPTTSPAARRRRVPRDVSPACLVLWAVWLLCTPAFGTPTPPDAEPPDSEDAESVDDEGEIGDEEDPERIDEEAEPSGEGRPASDEPLRIRLRRFNDALARGVGQLGTHPRYLSLVVLPFTQHGERTASHELGLLLEHTVRTAMTWDYGLPVVPRAAVRQAIEDEGSAERLDAETARKVGRRLSADAVILGSVSDAVDHFAVTATVFAVQGDGPPLEHRLLQIPAPQLLDAAAEARILRTKEGALWRSALVPGWGQFYNQQPLKGGLVAGLEAGLIAGAVVFHVLGARAESRYDWDLRESTAERERAEQHYLTRSLLVVLAAGVWMYGALDAYLSGADPDAEPTLAAVEGPGARRSGPSFVLLPLVDMESRGGGLRLVGALRF